MCGSRAMVVLLHGKSVKDSLLEAGYSPSTATLGATHTMRQNREEFVGVLAETIVRLLQTVIERLEATKTTYVCSAKTGETESFDLTDHHAGAKSDELLAKLAGLLVHQGELKVDHGGVDIASVIAATCKAMVSTPEPPKIHFLVMPSEDKNPETKQDSTLLIAAREKTSCHGKRYGGQTGRLLAWRLSCPRCRICC
jgi:hypothetical protein